MPRRPARRGGGAGAERPQYEGLLAARAVATAVDLLRRILDLLPQRSRVAVDRRLGDRDGACRSFQCRVASAPAPERRLVGAAGRGGAGRRRATSQPRPPDPHHRRDNGPEGGKRRPRRATRSGASTALSTFPPSGSAILSSPISMGARRSIGFRWSKARVASPIAPICNPTASPFVLDEGADALIRAGF